MSAQDPELLCSKPTVKSRSYSKYAMDSGVCYSNMQVTLQRCTIIIRSWHDVCTKLFWRIPVHREAQPSFWLKIAMQKDSSRSRDHSLSANLLPAWSTDAQTLLAQQLQ
eukprot:5181702-Amphidinium_carterae.1